VHGNLSADLNPARVPTAVAEAVKPPNQSFPPVWLQRLGLTLYVLFCMELGMLLVVLPWKPVWKANVLLADFPLLHAVFQNYFFRGLVTGLGVIDLCLGASAAVHYRGRRPKQQAVFHGRGDKNQIT
jgi:hypothetical protein